MCKSCHACQSGCFLAIDTMQVFLHISGWFPEGCIEVVGNAGNEGEAETGGGR